MSEKQIETLFIVTTLLSGTATPSKQITTERVKLTNTHRMKLRRIRQAQE
jgi:hypothetical protein